MEQWILLFFPLAKAKLSGLNFKVLWQASHGTAVTGQFTGNV
jgi:hypothetical protein